MINAKQAKELYNENWDREFTTIEDLFTRIEALAKNGAYQMCVYVDSKKTYNEVYALLQEQGYGVEDYNGGKNNILEINW